MFIDKFLKMSFLSKAKKCDLVVIGEELGEKVSGELKIIDLKQIIVKSENYEEEFVRNLCESTINERLEKERLEKRFDELSSQFETLDKQYGTVVKGILIIN